MLNLRFVPWVGVTKLLLLNVPFVLAGLVLGLDDEPLGDEPRDEPPVEPIELGPPVRTWPSRWFQLLTDDDELDEEEEDDDTEVGLHIEGGGR